MAMRSVANNSQKLLIGKCGLIKSLFSSSSYFSAQNAPTDDPYENIPTIGQNSPPPSQNLFVSGLSKSTTNEGLRNAFARFGQVENAFVVFDTRSSIPKSKGFGFVQYATAVDAEAGIKGMDGQFLDGWVIFAEYARPKPPEPPRNNSPRWGQR